MRCEPYRGDQGAELARVHRTDDGIKFTEGLIGAVCGCTLRRTVMSSPIRPAAFLLALAGSTIAVVGQVQTTVPEVVPGAAKAVVERITIHGTSLEGNLEADAVDRPAFVFLPPSYARERTRRYPVVYALHGYFIRAEQ